eukprot:scaffold35770_cov101-Isochrysis_galbana.AAC.6
MLLCGLGMPGWSLEMPVSAISSPSARPSSAKPRSSRCNPVGSPLSRSPRSASSSPPLPPDAVLPTPGV